MSDKAKGQIAFAGRLFNVELVEATRRDGTTTLREVVRHPGAVTIVPVLDSDRLVMIRNFRTAADQRLWELPAGKLEPGEDPQHAAVRELEEETGYRTTAIRKLGEFYTSPGFADELIRAYVARDLEFVGQRLEPGEDIEVEIRDADDVMRMIDTGEIRDAKTIAAVCMWSRNRNAEHR